MLRFAPRPWDEVAKQRRALNAVEIEEAISTLAEQPFDAQEFPFAFLQAFGNKETTLKRLRKGESNKSDIGGVLQTSNTLRRPVADRPQGLASSEHLHIQKRPLPETIFLYPVETIFNGDRRHPISITRRVPWLSAIEFLRRLRWAAVGISTVHGIAETSILPDGRFSLAVTSFALPLTGGKRSVA